MNASSIEAAKSWLHKRLDVYRRYGLLIQDQARAWADDDLMKVPALDDTKEQLLAWLRLDEPPKELARTAQASPEVDLLLTQTREELRRVGELEHTYQRALEGILMDTRTELANLAGDFAQDRRYGTGDVTSGSALDMTL